MPGGSILMTSAPKSLITVAAAGPAIKLAQSMTLSPSKMRSAMSCPSNIHPVRIVVPDDAAGGGAGEMRADHQYRPAREIGQHPFTGALTHLRVAIGGGAPFGVRDLTGVVHEVAGDQRLLAL